MKPEKNKNYATRVSGRRGVLLFLALAIVFSVAASATAGYPGWYDPTTQQGIRPNVPGFYQHQGPTNIMPADATNAGGVDEAGLGGGACFQTAFEDCMYGFAVQNPAQYGGLYPMSGNGWLYDMVANDNAIINLTNTMPPNGFINAYIGMNHAGGVGQGNYQANSLTVTEYDNNGTNNMMQIYQDQLLEGQDVLVFLTDPNYMAPAKWWWDGSGAGNFHVVEGAGVDCANDTIVFSDPDTTVNAPNTNDPNGVPRTDNAMGQALNNQVGKPWSNNYNRSYTTADPLPVPAAGTYNQMLASGYYQEGDVNAAGVFTSGPYAGAEISALIVICPEPGTVVLLCVGAVSLLAYAWRKSRAS